MKITTAFLNLNASDKFRYIAKFPMRLLNNNPSPPQIIGSGKNPYVETLRGLAIILVVFGHIIGYDKTGGMRVADDSIYRYLYFSLEFIRMPLFTVISGWVYANKPLTNISNRKTFLSGKAKRILVPMFTVGSLLFLMRIVTPGTNTTPELADLSRNLIFPYDIFWFLYSIFLVFIITSFVDTTSWFRKFKGWLWAFTGAIFLSVLSYKFLDQLPNIFSFKGATYLLPYFFLGIGLYRFKEILTSTKVAGVFMVGLIISISVQQLIWFYDLEHPARTSLLGFTIGICSTMLLFRGELKNNFLIWIGHYSFSIFLFHVFFTGGTRIILERVGIYNKGVILGVALCIAIIFPIVVEHILKRYRISRVGLLGMK